MDDHEAGETEWHRTYMCAATSLIVGPPGLTHWLVENCSTSIFQCATGAVDDVVWEAAVATGVPIDRLEIGAAGPALRGGTPAVVVRTRHLSEDAARAELGETAPDFLLVDDAQVLRMAVDDHRRFVVGFVESARSVDRFRLMRDALWAVAQPREGARTGRESACEPHAHRPAVRPDVVQHRGRDPEHPTR